MMNPKNNFIDPDDSTSTAPRFVRVRKNRRARHSTRIELRKVARIVGQIEPDTEPLNLIRGR